MISIIYPLCVYSIQKVWELNLENYNCQLKWSIIIITVFNFMLARNIFSPLSSFAVYKHKALFVHIFKV
jgi:hypothetical protein